MTAHVAGNANSGVSPPDFSAWRAQFPVLAQRVYLNSGSYGALALPVQAAIERYLAERRVVGADWDGWVSRHEALRDALAGLLGAQRGEIAVTTSASAGINALASALDFSGARRRVVVSDLEFPTSAQIWHAQERRGAELVHAAPAADGSFGAAEVAHHLDERTALVVVTHVCYRNGVRVDVPGIVRVAHACGARVLLDCYQSVGALQVDVRSLGIDFAVGGMAKYLLGTAGIGFLYVAAPLIAGLVPCDSGWFAQEDVGAMDIHGNHPASGARRFEAGTPPVVNGYAAQAGLRIVGEIGIAAIEERIRELTTQCAGALEDLGWPAVTPKDWSRRGPMLALPSRDAPALCAELAARGVVTSTRDGNLRASFHFYNAPEDIGRFIEILAALRGRYQGPGTGSP